MKIFFDIERRGKKKRGKLLAERRQCYFEETENNKTDGEKRLLVVSESEQGLLCVSELDNGKNVSEVSSKQKSGWGKGAGVWAE